MPNLRTPTFLFFFCIVLALSGIHSQEQEEGGYSSEDKYKPLKKLMAQFDYLKEKEREHIVQQLGTRAFYALLAQYTNKEIEAGSSTEAKERILSLRAALKPYLLEKFTKDNTLFLTKTLSRVKDDVLLKKDLAEILDQKGASSLRIPYLVDKLRHSSNYDFSDHDVLQAIALSKDPEAVEFMLEALGNPKAPKNTPLLCLYVLGRHGGQKRHRGGAESPPQTRSPQNVVRPNISF